MTGRTKSLTEEPMPGDIAPETDRSDVLSDALNVFRFTGAALLRGELTAPSAVDIPAASLYAQYVHPGATRVMVLHLISEGPCCVEADGVPRRQLPPGSIVGFPLGHAHRLSVGEGAVPVLATNLLPPPPWPNFPMLRHGGTGPRTRLICVYLRCDELLSNPILNSLPPLLVVSPEEDDEANWIAANATHIVRESLLNRPGGDCVIARLTELLFIEILRRHIGTLDDRETGWLAALADRHLARALACFHGEPTHQWTVDQVARRAGMSRTALTDRFQRVLSVSPMRYLTLWRLQLTAQALSTTEKSTAQIAEDVGYGSETALSRAFKRETGHAPIEWRRSRRLVSRPARPNG